MKRRAIIAIFFLLLIAANREMTMAQTQQTQPALPNGASSINETYSDWTVICSSAEKRRVCVLTQQQRKSDTKQLVLAAELNAVSKDEIKGSLVLPFGLRLAAGVAMQIDDGPASNPLPFSTCLPAGCIVQVSFNAATVKSLRTATAIKLTAKAHDNGADISFSISLKGFATAHDRALALARQ